MGELSYLLGAPQFDHLEWSTIAASFLLAFFFSVLIAKTYEYSHSGLSYSRSYVQSLILGSLIACMLIMAIGNSLVVGLGLMGTLAIVRFRSTMKDPKDMIYVFGSLGVGIACGVRAFEIAFVGTVVFCAVAVFIKTSPFSAGGQFEAVLKMRVPDSEEVIQSLHQVLREFCREYTLVSLREAAQGEEVDLAYHLQMRSKERQLELLRTLSEVEGVSGLDFVPQETAIQV